MKNLLTCMVLACAILQGCARFGRTVPIGVFDGDTGEPVAGATVSVGYDSMVYGVDLFPPHDDEETTGADGVAKVKVCRTNTILDAMAFAARDATIAVTAPGYLGYGAVPKDHVPRTFEPREVNGKKVYAVPIYRLPAPQIVIVVPDGYRGPVRVTRKFSNRWVQDEPGKRVFEFAASPQGDVEIEATPLLYRLFDWSLVERRENAVDTFRFRYASGQEIPRTSARDFSVIKFRTAMTQPTSQPDISPQARAWFERRRMATTRVWLPPRPPAFGFDFIISNVGLPWDEPPQKRSLFVVGGEQEMLRVYETVHPPPFKAFSQSRPAVIKSSDLFEEAWKVR